MREALDAASASGAVIQWAVASHSANELPFGALAAWTESGHGDSPELVRIVIEHLTSGSDAGPVLPVGRAETRWCSGNRVVPGREHNVRNLVFQRFRRDHELVTVSPHADATCRPHWSLARTWLLQPGLPGFAPVSDTHVDVVVLDIEDGLPDAMKPQGRGAVADWLHNGGDAWVRINNAATPEWDADLHALSSAPGLAGVMLAKAESAKDVEATAARLPAFTPIVALVESALGVESALEIARSCSRIAFGIGDFRRDTGMSADPMVLAYPRARLVIASRAAGLPAPIDGPTLRNEVRHLARETDVAKAAGMTGRLCLDAGHAETINTLLSPSTMEIDEARRTLARLDEPTGVYDGSAGPTRARAEAVLDLAAKLGVL